MSTFNIYANNFPLNQVSRIIFMQHSFRLHCYACIFDNISRCTIATIFSFDGAVINELVEEQVSIRFRGIISVYNKQVNSFVQQPYFRSKTYIESPRTMLVICRKEPVIDMSRPPKEMYAVTNSEVPPSPSNL